MRFLFVVLVLLLPFCSSKIFYTDENEEQSVQLSLNRLGTDLNIMQHIVVVTE